MTELEFLKVEQPEQIRNVASLAEEIWKEHYGEILDSGQIDYMVEQFQSVPAITSQLKTGGYEYYLMAVSGQPVGYIGVQPHTQGLFLSKLYLKKEWRGHGIARRALTFLEHYCKLLGDEKIWLTVNRHNADSIAAYQKMGFEKVREQVSDIGQGYVMDDFILEKQV